MIKKTKSKKKILVSSGSIAFVGPRHGMYVFTPENNNFAYKNLWKIKFTLKMYGSFTEMILTY